MSDTVTLPGTGTVVGSDEVTIGAVLQQVQRVKLVDGSDGGTGLIGGDATNGLDVDVTRVPTDPFGATADAAVTAGATGSISAKLRSISRDIAGLATAIVLQAGSAIIGKVGVDQTTPGTTNAVSLSHVGANAAATAGVNGTLAVGGNVATNVAIGTNPMNQGAQAISAENTAVTATRMVQLVADLVGKLIVLPYANPENFVSGAITSAMTGTASTSLLAAPASGLRNYITQIVVSNSHATVGTDVIIQDGNGGTTLYTIPAAAVYGGAVVTFPVPLRQPTTATAIYCANVTTGSSTKVSASGYKGV